MSKSIFITAIVCRVVCRKHNELSSGIVLGSMYHVPQELKNFLDFNLQDKVPQQNLYKKSKNPMFYDVSLPQFLWGFTEDLEGFLDGSIKIARKDSKIHGPKVNRVPEELLYEGQKWIESFGYDNLGDMFIEFRKDFEEWIIRMHLAGLKSKSFSMYEMNKIESLIGKGHWQKIIPIKLTNDYS